MKNGKHGVIAQIAGPGLVLAALLATALSSTIAGFAQTSASSPTTPEASPVQPTAKTAAQPARQSPSKGQHEGIKVHGHWTIEVRNPDGKLVTHREFENSLTLGLQEGSSLLTGLLGRAQVTGSWEIILATNGGSMHIDEPNTTLSSVCNFAACGPNLSVVAGTAVSPGVLTFTGFVSVPAGQTSISIVETNNLACNPTVLPSACLTTPIEGINNGTSTDFLFTQANLSPAITITPGQVVQVTVNISFQ